MTGRIFITGDKHGTFVPLFNLAEKTKLCDTDIIIIAGDASYVWNESYQSNLETLQQIFPGVIAFIDGNHENHALLNEFEISKWNGGNVHHMAERVYHLMRGEIYSIYENNFFTFGGARSVDKDRREEGVSWWKEEEPTLEEMEHGEKQLKNHFDQLDYIITHEAPLFARACIKRLKPIDDDYNLPTLFEHWYQMVSNAPRLKKWYFGHMHVDQLITPKLRAINNDILLSGEENPFL